jgi:hypothetical protein
MSAAARPSAGGAPSLGEVAAQQPEGRPASAAARPSAGGAPSRRIAACIALGAALAVHADEATRSLLDRALAAETASVELLLDHYRIEEELLSPGADRLGVLLTLPPATVVEAIVLQIDGDRRALPPPPASRRAVTVPLQLRPVASGLRNVRLELRVAGARAPLQHTVSIDKDARARFVEFQLEPAGVLTAQQW